MLGEPYRYRDERNARGRRASCTPIVPPDELYRRERAAAPAVQHALPADRRPARPGTLELADSFLLIPDLFAFWLTGRAVAERTNASTTGLLGVTTRASGTRRSSTRLGLPRRALPAAGRRRHRPRRARPRRALRGVGRRAARVTTVGSHDTASAVVAIPASGPDFAYISCGTWSLVGVELERPVLSDASRLAGLHQRGRRRRPGALPAQRHGAVAAERVRAGVGARRQQRLAAGAAGAGGGARRRRTPVPVFDADDEAFLAPGDMPRADRGVVQPSTTCPCPRPGPSSCAASCRASPRAYARSIRDAAELSGTTVSVVHLVGGGSQNALLCQLTADATGLPVLAGPGRGDRDRQRARAGAGAGLGVGRSRGAARAGRRRVPGGAVRAARSSALSHGATLV